MLREGGPRTCAASTARKSKQTNQRTMGSTERKTTRTKHRDPDARAARQLLREPLRLHVELRVPRLLLAGLLRCLPALTPYSSRPRTKQAASHGRKRPGNVQRPSGPSTATASSRGMSSSKRAAESSSRSSEPPQVHMHSRRRRDLQGRPDSRAQLRGPPATHTTRTSRSAAP